MRMIVLQSERKWQPENVLHFVTLATRRQRQPKANKRKYQFCADCLLPVYARLCATANFISISILIYDCDCYVWGNNRSQILVSL